jgi:hypothetical protein
MGGPLTLQGPASSGTLRGLILQPVSKEWKQDKQPICPSAQVFSGGPDFWCIEGGNALSPLMPACLRKL